MNACQNPSPIIDGRRANCNIAAIGANKNRTQAPQHGLNQSIFLYLITMSSFFKYFIFISTYFSVFYFSEKSLSFFHSLKQNISKD